MIPTLGLLLLAPFASTQESQRSSDAVPLTETRLVVAVGSDLQVHSVETGRQVRAGADGYNRGLFARHASTVSHLALDPRAEFLAASSVDGHVALWRIENEGHQGAAVFPGAYASPEVILQSVPETWVGARIAWTYDGGHLLTWSADWSNGPSPTTVQLWTREGDLVWTGGHARWAAVSPTSNWVAAVCEDELLLLRPGEKPHSLSVPGAQGALDFSPDGKRVVVAGQGRRMWVVDVETQAVTLDVIVDVQDFAQDRMYMTRAHWSPNGQWVGFTVGKGLLTVVVDPADGRLVWTGGFQGGQMYRVFDCAWTPDNRVLTGWSHVECHDPLTSESTILLECVTALDMRHAFPVEGGKRMVIVVGGILAKVDLGTNERVW